MNLTKFIQRFPTLEPPLTLTEDSVFSFSKHNKLINREMANQFFSEYEIDYIDSEDTEYIPCFRFQISDDFHTLVYWRASALQYEYYLITVDKRGKLLDRKLIGGIVGQEAGLLRMVTSIDINYIIYVVASLTGIEVADETQSQSYSLEILPDGSIISS